ncbi:hypothetical protein HispidOSU_004139, partial [Sigmodon hispidus]
SEQRAEEEEEGGAFLFTSGSGENMPQHKPPKQPATEREAKCQIVRGLKLISGK